MKKVLMVATVPSMIGQFNMNNIRILQELGYEVHVACDFEDRSIWTDERIARFKMQLQKFKVMYFQVDFSRSPLKLWKHGKSYVQLKKIFKENEYAFVHCHTPIASIICRLVARAFEVRCIYTAHGFHFYKGASLKNWLIFYPIEKFFSRWTDILITITKEDFVRARNKFHARHVEYVPGVGVEIADFSCVSLERNSIKTELGLEEGDKILLSIGELNRNKNHETIIRTLPRLSNDLHYVVAGTGELYNYLNDLAKSLSIENRVHLLGFRSDVKRLLKECEAYIHPSFREGLSVAIMEAMASGRAVICADIRGNNDLIENEKGGFLVRDDEYFCGIKSIINNPVKANKMGEYNRRKVEEFSRELVDGKMKMLYMTMEDESENITCVGH